LFHIVLPPFRTIQFVSDTAPAGFQWLLDGLIVTDGKKGNNIYQLFFDIVKYFFL